ncbi:MAG: tRNA lysidine(34) synthetase TilS, partial [Alphaproteobacteria bacterium]|nr:tRNA lysidine(34) synthetase TilS [Alphaproteobacteria bacterium]
MAEFQRAMLSLGPFESSPHIAVACSGGPDSLALTLLANDWARGVGGRVTALVVDHAMRRESAAEAA